MPRALVLLPFAILVVALAGCPARKDLCPPGDYEKVCPPRERPSELARRACIADCREDDDLAILRSQMKGAEADARERACIARCMEGHGAAGYSTALLAECDRQFDLVCGLFRYGSAEDATVSEKIRAAARAAGNREPDPSR